MTGRRMPAASPAASSRQPRRSRTGCLECRKRKIKCDESKPQCNQCRRSGRSCSIIDSVFRPHHFSYSQPVATEQAEDRQETNDWAGVANIDVSRSGQDEGLFPSDQSFSFQPSTHLHESENGSGPGKSTPGQVEDPGITIDDLNTPAVVFQQPTRPFSETQSPVQVHSSPGNYVNTSPQVFTPFSQVVSPAVDDAQTSNEVAFLLRHYSEGFGKAMDMVGFGQYFSRRALMLSRESDLVRAAACAAAAKHIGQMRAAKRHLRASKGYDLVLRTLKAAGRDFLWCGAKYYEKAIKAMAEEITLDTASSHPTTESSPLATTIEMTSPASVASSTTARNSFENRFLAACVMCQYERLSNSVRALDRHLNGIFNFLQLDKAQDSSPVAKYSESLRSLFWTFVQYDFEESLISQKPTRSDPDNLALWRSMGLPLNDAGFFADGSTIHPAERDSVAIQAMFRLMCKLVNLLSVNSRILGRGQTPATPMSDASSIHHAPVFWTDLYSEFNDWFSALPPSFDPDTVRPRDPDELNAGSAIFSKEIWFTNSACAVALMYYRMAQILFLVSKPADLLISGYNGSSTTSTPPDWLQINRALEKDLFLHAQELLSIALGLSDDTMRIHMIQPLYVAGRCLTTEPDQRMLVDMLQGIEDDLGMTTGYRVQALIDEWGISPPLRNTALDRELSDLSSAEDG